MIEKWMIHVLDNEYKFVQHARLDLETLQWTNGDRRNVQINEK